MTRAEVVDLRSSAERVMEMEELVGRLRATDLLPQYLMRAMLGGEQVVMEDGIDFTDVYFFLREAALNMELCGTLSGKFQCSAKFKAE
jgi:hypothetical protein